MTNASKQALRRERILAATLTVLLGAVLVTSHAVSGAVAKYTTAASSSDEARVALFAVDSSENYFPKTWPVHLVPNATSVIIVDVSNEKGGKVSEVAQEYELEIVTSGNLPITYTVYKSDGAGKVDLTPVGKMFEEYKDGDRATFSSTDGSMTFQAGDARTDTYRIEVKWPAAYNDARWANIPDFVQVNINVKQID